MSAERNRAKLSKAHSSKDYKRILNSELYPVYWEEGVNFYPKYRRGFKNPAGRSSYLMKFEVRMYRSWKYNRRCQYREK